jgi:hypothetical protein
LSNAAFASRKRAKTSLLPGYEKRQGLLVQLGKQEQLNEIDPPLPPFDIAHERLRLFHQPRDFHLGQAGFPTGLLQQTAEIPIEPRVIGRLQSFRSFGRLQTFYFRVAEYLKIRYFAERPLEPECASLTEQ